MAADELSVKITARDEMSAKLKDINRELNKSVDGLAEYGRHLDTMEGRRAYDAERDRVAALSREQRRLKSDVAKTGREIKKLATEGAQSGNRLASAWKKASKVFNNDLVAGVSAGALVLFGKNAVQAFARVEDSTAALTATFGEAGNQMVAWAETSADAFNLSKAEALDAQLTFANFARSAGLSGEEITKFSVDLTKRAADMASYFGGSVTDAIQAIQSGLQGQSEPLRRYSVLLDDATLRAKALTMGLVDNVKTALTPQNKILAANALLLEQSAQVNGDVARTADSMGNKIKDAQQQMADFQSTAGETISVALSPLLGLLNGAMDTFNGLPGPVKSTAIAVGLLGAAALVAGPRLEVMHKALKEMGPAALGAGKAAGVIGAIGTAALIAAPYLEQARQALDDWSKSMLGIKTQSVDDATLALRNLAQASDDAALAERMRSFQGVLDELAQDNATDFLRDFTSELVGTTSVTESAMKQVDSLDEVLTNLYATGNTAEAARIWKTIQWQASDAGMSIDDLRSMFDGYTGAVSRAKLATDSESGGLFLLGNALTTAKTGADATTGSMNLLAQANRNADAASRGLNAALQGVNNTIARAQAMRAYEAALAEFVKNPSIETGEAVELAMTSAAATFEKPEKAAKFVTGAVDEIGAAVKDSDLPKNIKTALTDPLEVADKKAQNVLDTANAINAFKPKAIDFVVTVNGQPVNSAADARAAARGTTAFAMGGPVPAGTNALVGEVGPELFVPNVGQPKVIGADGPEFRRFDQPGYVIPNYALAAPSLDVRLPAAPVPAIPAAPSGDGRSIEVTHGGATVNIGTIQAAQGVDVESRVLHALLRADRIKRERG